MPQSKKEMHIQEKVLPNLVLPEPEKNIELVEDEPEIYDSDVIEEKNAHLIKYEFNLIEFPFFSKDDKICEGVIKKYIFNEKDNAFMRLIPSADPLAISRKILQEFDEKIFYAILKLYNTQKRDDLRVVTDYYSLIHLAKLKYNGKNLLRTKDSLHRLKHTKIELNNIFYNAEMRKVIKNDNIAIEILSELRVMDLQKTLELGEAGEDYSRYFRNRKIDNIIIIRLNDFLLKNIINKGFLYIDSERLLDIGNSVARKLYLLLKKWHGYEKGQLLTRKSSFLASRIPLSWHPKNIGSTIKTLQTACDYLKEHHFIMEYEFFGNNHNIRLQDSYFEFTFQSVKDAYELANATQSFITGQETLQIVAEEDKAMFLLDETQRREVGELVRGSTMLSQETACSLAAEYGMLYEFRYVVYVLKKTLQNAKEDAVMYFKKAMTEGYFRESFDNTLELTKEDPCGDLKVYLIHGLAQKIDKAQAESYFDTIRIHHQGNLVKFEADDPVYLERLRTQEADIRTLLMRKIPQCIVDFSV